MKQLYVCELCGASYEDFDECHACESGHCKEFVGGVMQEKLQSMYAYQPKKALPATVYAAVKKDVWNEEAGNFIPEYHIGMYVLKQELSKEKTDEITEEQRRRDAEERAYWDKYWEDKKAQKEAEEAAKKATEEAVAE